MLWSITDRRLHQSSEQPVHGPGQVMFTAADHDLRVSIDPGSVNDDTRQKDSVCLLCHAAPAQKYP